MKLFEYAASGVPMVVARQPTTLSLVRDGEQALLVSPDSAAELADAVKRLMASPELAAGLATRAREWVRRYSYEERARRYQDFLEQVFI
jgi:glycosyltransferase involved in cell wall biosynthesis